MASTTAEVLLYFGESGYRFNEAVNKLRFTTDPEMNFDEIISILGPVWAAAYSKGWDDGFGDGSE